MLEVLPPLKWVHGLAVETFCMSEMDSGSYTSQFAKLVGAEVYCTRTVDHLDKTTWITAEEILKALKEQKNATIHDSGAGDS